MFMIANLSQWALMGQARTIAVNSTEIADVIKNQIDTLIETEGVSPNDIKVLTGSSQKYGGRDLPSLDNRPQHLGI